MNTRETVMLSADANYIPVKYAVIEVTIGSTLANSYAWLKCISNGIASVEDFNTVTEAVRNSKDYDPSLLKGTVGAYSVSALSAIKEYSTPKNFSGGSLLLG